MFVYDKKKVSVLEKKLILVILIKSLEQFHEVFMIVLLLTVGI